MDLNEEISQLIGSRICHDLVSPIGAIGNGLELMQMTAPRTAPELELVQESLNSVNARIRFFRLAFGKASAAQIIGTIEVSGLLGDLGRGGRITYHWLGPDSAPRTEVQAVCLALMCLETTLPLGGDISITQDCGRWTLTAKGRRISWDGRTWDSLVLGTKDGLSPKDVQFALLPKALAKMQRTPVVSASQDCASLTF